MNLDTYIVNAFTEELACGNPAGVVFIKKGIQDEVLQKIALDIGKSETAFIEENNHKYFIRWFSPIKEMPLCGHATLAAAKVLFMKYNVKEISFLYRDGVIETNIDQNGFINMTFPLDQYKKIEIDPIFKEFFGNYDFKDCIYGLKTKKVIIILNKDVNIRLINPKFELMKNNTGLYINGIGLSKESDEYDFETRFFNPWAGVNEDPVTGSVHTVLARYWSEYYNKNEIISYQNSQRPGIIKLRIIDNNSVEIKGKAKIIVEGILRI